MISSNQFLRQSSTSYTFAVLAGLAMLLLTPASRAQEFNLQIEQVQTKIEFSLGSTLHTVHGTFALKSGAIRFDPSSGKIDGEIIVDAASGQSGSAMRDDRMHREILESAKFPEIVFTPTKVAGVIAAEGNSKLQVSGRFRLHGQDREVTFPVEFEAEGKTLRIVSQFEIPYLQWGLKNPGNFFLHVSDKVAVDIHAMGRLQSGEIR